MPTPISMTDLNALVRPQVQAVIDSNFYNRTMFGNIDVVPPSMLPGGGVSGGGGAIGDVRGLNFQVAYRKNLSGGQVDPGGALNAPSAELKIACHQDFAMFHGAFSLSHMQVTEMLQAGPGGMLIADELARQKAALVNAIIDPIETALMAGSTSPGGTAFLGLVDLVAASGNIYGQSRTTYPALASLVSTGGGTPRSVTKTIMDGHNVTMKTTRGGYQGSRQAIWTTDTLKAAMVGLGAHTIYATTPAGERAAVQIASGEVYYENAKVHAVNNATSGVAYRTDLDSHKIVVLPDGGSIAHVLPPQQVGDLYTWHAFVYIQQVILDLYRAGAITELTA